MYSFLQYICESLPDWHAAIRMLLKLYVCKIHEQFAMVLMMETFWKKIWHHVSVMLFSATTWYQMSSLNFLQESIESLFFNKIWDGAF